MSEFKRLFLKIANFEIFGFVAGSFVTVFAFVIFYNISISAGLSVYDALLCSSGAIGQYLGSAMGVLFVSAFVRLVIRQRWERLECQEKVDDAIEECTDWMVNRYDKRS